MGCGKRIKTGVALTLEVFVAMKTRSIHNSVKKWADRAISGAKSVIGWFRTGGQKNREIIEKVQKRQTDHFRHEAHKNSRKKRRKKDSTVYSIMRQTSLCGFMSIKNNLY